MKFTNKARHLTAALLAAVALAFAVGAVGQPVQAASMASVRVCPMGQACYDTDDGPTSLQTACQWYFGLPLNSQPNELTIEILDGVSAHCSYYYDEFFTDESTIEILDHHEENLRVFLLKVPDRQVILVADDLSNIVWGVVRRIFGS